MRNAAPCITEEETLESAFPEPSTFSISVGLMSRNLDLNMTPNRYTCAIYGRLEVASDVVSSRNVKTIEGWTWVNFEVAKDHTTRNSG